MRSRWVCPAPRWFLPWWSLNGTAMRHARARCVAKTVPNDSQPRVRPTRTRIASVTSAVNPLAATDSPRVSCGTARAVVPGRFPLNALFGAMRCLANRRVRVSNLTNRPRVGREGAPHVASGARHP